MYHLHRVKCQKRFYGPDAADKGPELVANKLNLRMRDKPADEVSKSCVINPRDGMWGENGWSET